MNNDNNNNYEILEWEGMTGIEEYGTTKIMKEKPQQSDTIEEKIKNILTKNINTMCESSNIEIKNTDFFKRLTCAIMENLPAKHFVGIQPLTGPVDKIYSLQNSNENKCSFQINGIALEARTRQMKIQLTPEGVDDMNSNSNDLQNSIFQTLKDDLTTEIYQEIRNDIITVSHKRIKTFTKNVNTNKLCLSINLCANEIQKKTGRGPGNFIITSKKILNIIQDNLKIEPEYLNRDYKCLKYIGTLYDTIKVYCDYYIEPNTIIIGYKGVNGETDAGMFYCPYMLIASIINNAATPEKMNVLTRYAKHVVRKTDEQTSADGTMTTITREPCNYYITLTVNLPKSELNNSTTEKIIGNNILDLDNIDTKDAFDFAMQLLT